MSRRILIVLAVVLVVIVGGYAYLKGARKEAPQANGALQIGIVLPLSGSMAEYGDNGRKGLLLAKDELAKSGVAVDLLIQDTKESPEDTVTAVRRLIDANGVKFIIGGLTSSGTLAAAPYAQQKGVLFFSPAASAPGIPEIGDLIFRNWQSDSALADKYGAFAASSLGLRKIAIVSISNDYGKTNSETFEKSFSKDGGQVLFRKSFPQGSTNFRDVVTSLRGVAGLDSVFLVGYPDEYRALFGEMKRQGVKDIKVLVSDTFYSPSMPKDIGETSEGVICAAASKPDNSYPARRQFIDAYKLRYKKDPGLVSDTAYDALKLVVQGVRETDGTPKGVSKWLLAQKNYPGAAGPTTFTPSGDFEGGMTVYRVEKGQFIPVRP